MVDTTIDVQEILAGCTKKEKNRLLRALLTELVVNEPRKAVSRIRDDAGQIVAYLVPAAAKVVLPPVEDTTDYESLLKARAEEPGPDFSVAEVEAMLDAEFGPLPPDPKWEAFVKSQSSTS